jgi:hypothetical protein
MNAVTKSLTVIVLLIAATPVMARKLAEIPIVVDNSVIGDRNADGVVDMHEATALMKDCSLKREMFSQKMDEQKRLYLSLEKKDPAQVDETLESLRHAPLGICH